MNCCLSPRVNARLDSVLCSFIDWCIVEWDGENTYDCLHKDKLTALEGDLKFKAVENVLAVHRGKPFKATIAIIAGTESYLISDTFSEIQ